MSGEFHEPSAASFVRGLDRHGADRVDTKGFLVALLPPDEVVIAAELLEHVGHHHGAPVGFEERMGELILGAAVAKSKRERGVGLDG